MGSEDGERRASSTPRHLKLKIFLLKKKQVFTATTGSKLYLLHEFSLL